MRKQIITCLFNECGNDSMIPNQEIKQNQILTVIRNHISEINQRYRNGPELYFYRRLQNLRNEALTLEQFITSQYNLEILYATLVAWDMNSRAAKMKYFDEFKTNLLEASNELYSLENLFLNNNYDFTELSSLLRAVYIKLHLMTTSKRLVSNSKVLHFLFPNILIPIDKKNTLMYLYESKYESIDRYLEIIKFSLGIISLPENWQNYLDNKWNFSIPKIIDNAIILRKKFNIT